MSDFDINKALSVNEVMQQYISDNKSFHTYNEKTNCEAHPFIDDAFEIYQRKKQAILERREAARLKRINDEMRTVMQAESSQTSRKSNMINRLRAKLQQKNKQ